MKLVNRLMAGQKLALSSGIITVDAEGGVEVEDKAAAAALQAAGFKPAFARKEPKPESKPEPKPESKPEPKPEPVSTPKADHSSKKKGK